MAEQHMPAGMAKSSCLEQQAGLRKNKQTNKHKNTGKGPSVLKP